MSANSQSSNNATLNTVIDQVEWIERIIGDFIVAIKAHVNRLAEQSEKTFGSFGDRFVKGNENLNNIAATTHQKCESLPSFITIVTFLVVTGIVIIISLIYFFAKCLQKIVYHHYIKVRGSKIYEREMLSK